MPVSLSTCLIVRDEEQLIEKCLRSIQPISDEIIVVDTGSRDRTASIARSYGARVIDHQWTSFLAARNTYMEAARGRWILVLDGDEAIAAGDLENIVGLMRSRSRIGYRLAIRNYTDQYDLMWNWFPNDRRYRREEAFSRCPGWMKTQALRLFRNLPGVRYKEGVSAHPTPMESLRRLPGLIEDRDDVVIHHFQHLKGGGRFVAAKQRIRLRTELEHVRRFPDDPYPYLNAARTLFAERRDAEALRLLKRAIRVDRSFHDAYQLHGMIDFENGRLASAARVLRRAIEIDPASADAWALLGMVLVEDSRQNEALHALERAIELRPHHLLAHNSLGVLYEDLGRNREALRQYRAAARLHPGFKPASANLRRLSGKDARARP